MQVYLSFLLNIDIYMHLKPANYEMENVINMSKLSETERDTFFERYQNNTKYIYIYIYTLMGE